MIIKKTQKIFRYFGIDITRYRKNVDKDFINLLNLYKVDTIFDIGANIGMSAEKFRKMGFKKKIVSFEPVNYLYKELAKEAKNDQLWLTENIAIGDKDTTDYINVTGGLSDASSILEMTENVIKNAPKQKVLRKEKVNIKTISSIIDKYYPIGNKLFLKIDVQGYEKKVIEGADSVLDRIVGIKLEMSLVQNYIGETLYTDMIEYLNKLGYKLVAILNGWSDPVTRQLYQIDGIFFNTSIINN